MNKRGVVYIAISENMNDGEPTIRETFFAKVGVAEDSEKRIRELAEEGYAGFYDWRPLHGCAFSVKNMYVAERAVHNFLKLRQRWASLDRFTWPDNAEEVFMLDEPLLVEIEHLAYQY